MFRNVQSNLFRKLYSNCTHLYFNCFFYIFQPKTACFLTFITFLFLVSVIQ